MPEKDFTKKLTDLIKIADKIVQDVEEAVGTARELQSEALKIRERFKPEDDERLGES